MKIAYIEDDQDARFIFSSRLQNDGFECRVFDSAEDFLNDSGIETFDVIISDIEMPGINGVECIERLRQKGVQTPCVLITAFNSLEYARSALNAKANYLLEKPFNYQTLRQVIQKTAGSPMTVEYCVQKGLASLALTPREKEIAQLILKGLNNGDIARFAGLSEKTVKQHITQIFQKAGVSSRPEFFSSIFPV